jgi:ABC-2 type transport system ATP-binding protein
MIETAGLTRVFGSGRKKVVAVDGVSLTVREGEIVACVGPNGAGKTTLQRMLCTLLSPSSGEATVAGRDLRRDPMGVRSRIGYVPQSGGANPAVPVEEELTFVAELQGMSGTRARQAASQVMKDFELTALAGTVARSLSGGQRRRLDLALGMIHDPRLIFLDEPTVGLDPPSRANLWRHIRARRDERGATVLLTTHYLDEADALCDRLIVIDGGRVVAEGTPSELKRRVGGDIVTMVVGGGVVERAGAILNRETGVRGVVSAGDVVRVTVDSGDQRAFALMRSLDAAGVAISSIQVAGPTLDDAFLTLTGHSLRDASPA